MATLHSGVCSSVTPTAVKEIIDTDLTDARINSFINMAYFATIRLIDELDECGGGDALCEIQLLLAAHFITVYQRQPKSESIGGEYSVTYLGADGEGFKASIYGQQAIDLDCSGELSKVGLKRADMRIIGYEDLEEQEPAESWYD